jgi:enoyl-CoA hydratase
MSQNEILARLDNGIGFLSLNRPAALHALNQDMCETLIHFLELWRDRNFVKAVVIGHVGPKGFCAGGDIRMLATSGAGDGRAAEAFFRVEYQLNALLMSYPKPLIVFMDGIVMGGGVGLALPCPRRIATERTTFAMPETGIGLFPDVGGGWHLPRLPGETGLWIALTGVRLKAADCLDLGIATHVVESARLPELALAMAASPGDLDTVLKAFAVDPGPSTLTEHRALIDAAFSMGSVEEIIAALKASPDAFAAEQVEILAKKSPQTLKVAFRQLRAGKALTSFDDNMAMEFRIGARVVRRHDFHEGVRAVIIDKDQAPQWRPETLEGVDDALLDAIFAPLPPSEEWRPLESHP